VSSLTGLPQSAVIVTATAAFAAFAWTNGSPREPAPACDPIRIVQYLPIPEPTPLIRTPPLGWPVLERQRADDAPTVEKVVAKDDDAEAPRRHHYRRHWRRR
jgi:hypothetical protein